MSVKCFSAAVSGIDAIPVEVLLKVLQISFLEIPASNISESFLSSSSHQRLPAFSGCVFLGLGVSKEAKTV